MKTIRIHYLQHVAFEGLGCIEDWALAKGHQLTSTKFYEDRQLPELSAFDWLIVMGGPMSVYDEEKYNWLQGEKEFIRNSIQADKIVIGICLGAQLIASALDAKVFPNGEKEIGWFPVSISNNLQTNNILGEDSVPITVFHWHGDTFDLPENSIRIASSEACLNQAFLYHKKVVGLQFHFEVTEKSLQQMIAFCGDELVAGRYIQSAEKMLEKVHHIRKINIRMFKLLDNLESKTEI